MESATSPALAPSQARGAARCCIEPVEVDSAGDVCEATMRMARRASPDCHLGSEACSLSHTYPCALSLPRESVCYHVPFLPFFHLLFFSARQPALYLAAISVLILRVLQRQVANTAGYREMVWRCNCNSSGRRALPVVIDGTPH
jgi:hypothetical protein